MTSLIALSRQTKRMAAFAALVATMLTTGGTLALAQHYAQTAGDAAVYMAGNPPQRHAAPASNRQANSAQVATLS